MKIDGLIGGMSWESTIPYYRQINESIKERLGGLHSAKIILYMGGFCSMTPNPSIGRTYTGKLVSESGQMTIVQKALLSASILMLALLFPFYSRAGQYPLAQNPM